MKLRRWAGVVLASCLGLASFACSSSDADGGGGGGSAASTSVPTDSTVETLAAFLDAESYKGENWTPETTEPRATDGSHAGRARVWLNDVTIAGQAAEAWPVDTMAVKELFDDSGRVGVAALWKTDEGTSADAWLYYCYGPAGHCSHSEPEHPKDDPLYARGFTPCGFCHSTVTTRITR